MFAITFDRDPLTLADVPGGVVTWLQVVGGFSYVAALLWLGLGLPRMRAHDRARIPGWMSTLFVAALGLATLGYLLAVPAGLIGYTGSGRLALFAQTSFGVLLAAAGAFAFFAVALPLLRNLPWFRFRRIFALARLSFKEALRRRVLYAFAGIILVFLFASWFLFDTKPEDEVRTYVSVVFEAITWPLLLAALLVAAFSIPTDIKNQTIHTIVTKPVERFEIVVGRFLGFLALMTLVLVALTLVSVLYVLRGVNPAAAAESLKARDPLYGELRFENTDDPKKAINVGREWEYRYYISSPSPGQEAQTARWDFARAPAALNDSRPSVRFEYTFDIYRTTKGEKEGADVTCTIRLYSWRFQKGNDAAFKKDRGLTNDPARDSALARKYGYFEITGQPVTDYHTMAFLVPAGLFENIAEPDRDLEQQFRERGETRPPDLQVRVTCESATQYVGMARHDLYVRLDNPQTPQEETRAFVSNFFKSAFGLWLKLALVIGLAVVLSTYLSGVITLLVVTALFFGGVCRDFVESVALRTNPGGGPAESMLRIARRELTGPSLYDSTATTDRIVGFSDNLFRVFIRVALYLIPDVNRYTLTDYVADGFNISWPAMLTLLLLLAGYLIPFFMLSFYLIRWREVASST
jgi:ABC-type transport system involved in multi-copper enzyme maturation permease subunit